MRTQSLKHSDRPVDVTAIFPLSSQFSGSSGAHRASPSWPPNDGGGDARLPGLPLLIALLVIGGLLLVLWRRRVVVSS
jgi:hypothetical protein